ncbi:MAG: hypothetical protein AABW83_02785 [Nanoarchaeota archaeon]
MKKILGRNNTSLRIRTIYNSDIGLLEKRMDISIIDSRRLENKPVLDSYLEDNKYDIVLACEPSAKDNYPLYDKIVELVTKNNFKIYAPHKDIRGNQIDFMVNEAIPNTKGVLIHLNPINPNVRELFQTTLEYNKPFIMFYDFNTIPFNKETEREINSRLNFIREIKYSSERDAIILLEANIEELIKAAKIN